MRLGEATWLQTAAAEARYGWKYGQESLIFRAVDLNEDEIIDVCPGFAQVMGPWPSPWPSPWPRSDLKWLDVQAKRAKIKRSARLRAMKEKKKHGLNPKAVLETMVDASPGF